MKYLVIDFETNILNTGDEAVGKMKAAPWNARNDIVVAGYKYSDRDEVTLSSSAYINYLPDWVLVGHNIKFDIHHALMSKHTPMYPATIEKFLPEGRIWDTQLAEYIITGQRATYSSLDSCSEKYGGSIKDDRIKKDYWDNDIDTEDIPEELLHEYLKNDVLNTEVVFLRQYLKARELGILPLIWSQMKALKASISMEYNGMWFNLEKADHICRNDLEPILEDYLATMIQDMKEVGMEEPNPMSTRDVGLFLFGGKQMTMQPVAQLDPVSGMPKRYKSGPRKGNIVTKNEPIHKEIIGLFHDKGEKTESGQWAVGDQALKKFDSIIIDCLLAMRQLSKDISTYFRGYSELVWREDQDGGIIHHSLHHCSTGTGRLSSTKPNLQNVTTED